MHSLSDFDWKLLFAVASDKIASIKQPLLRLELYTQPEHSTTPGTQGTRPPVSCGTGMLSRLLSGVRADDAPAGDGVSPLVTRLACQRLDADAHD